MKLDLEDRRLDTGIAFDINNKGALNIAEPDVFYQAFIYQGLQSLPGLLVRSVL